MKLLAWDTSSKSGAIAALEWDASSREGWAGVRLVSEWSLDVDSRHSERLLWGIHQVLEAARWRLEEIDVLGAGVGPGSFTGLRIGLTTARTLAHALGKPLVGVSSLAALARPVALWLKELGDPAALVIAATDACKGELFSLWGSASAVADCVTMAEGDSPGLWKRGAAEKALRPEELMRVAARRLSARAGGRRPAARWIAVGEGRKRYAEAWKLLPPSRELEAPDPSAHQVQGRYLGMLAWEAHQAGLARQALEVRPRYARASDAEIKLRSGLLRRAPS